MKRPSDARHPVFAIVGGVPGRSPFAGGLWVLANATSAIEGRPNGELLKLWCAVRVRMRAVETVGGGVVERVRERSRGEHRACGLWLGMVNFLHGRRTTELGDPSSAVRAPQTQ